MLEKLNFIEDIPENQRHRIKKVRYRKDEFLNYDEKNKFGLILEGEVAAARYQDGQEFFFPYILKTNDILGIGRYFEKDDWETVVYSEILEVLEIPLELMEKYIFCNFDYYNSIMKKRDKILKIGIRGFFIRLHGGTKAYLAYLLFLYSEGKNVILFDRYIDTMKVLFANKAMLYRVTKELVEENIILKEKKKIVLRDRELLKSYFEEFIYE